MTIHAGFDLVFFGGALMFGAIVCAIWALWEPLVLVLVPPFVASGALAWWRWLSYRIVIGPRDVRIGRMLGNAHTIPFKAIERVRFLRVRQTGRRNALKVNWTTERLANSLQVPFETPAEQRGVRGAPLQMWIERSAGTPPQVRLNLDFVGEPADIQTLYEALPHVVSPGFSEANGPTQAMPKWW